MAQDRLFHKRLGHSEKVNALTDFEYIVWTCYVLSADDYGVMRCSAVTLQADHDRLAAKPAKRIVMALNWLVELKLLAAFEHQGRRYVCQLDWQDYQKVRFPTRSSHPKPPPEILSQCTELTRKHFGVNTEMPPKSSRENVISSAVLPHENENGNALTGKKDAPISPPPPDAHLLDPVLTKRAGALVERYQALYQERRAGARYRPRPNLDWVEACDLCRIWDDQRLEKMAVVLLETDEPWIAGTDRSFKIFAMKASWADDKLRQWELKHGVTA